MANRTFKQMGLGFSNAPATIIAKIDSATVYMGPVPTVNQPLPADYSTGETIAQAAATSLFQWDQPMEFRGTQELEITVTSGRLLLVRTLANNTDIEGAVSPPGWHFAQELQGDFGPIHRSDPLSNVKINGRLQPSGDFSKKQMMWVLQNGDILTATISMELPAQPV